MGMSYFIYPDKPTHCKDNFGEGLCLFFGEVGGYGEKAESAQVSQILKIDLTVFQDVGYDPENQGELNKHWHSIDKFTGIVDSLITKINSHPDFYKQVIYNPNEQQQHIEISKAAQLRDSTKFLALLEEQKKQPFYGYPGDYGFLHDGRLQAELQLLKQTLICYKANGVTKVRLEYQ